MKRTRFAWIGITGVLLSCLLPTLYAAEINLDSYQRCGDLFCYQSLDDATSWYYLPDQPRIAVKNGKPQFSFIKYVRNEKSGEAGTHLAQGGGVVHFLVTYGVTAERQSAAEKALQKIDPDAVLKGPVIYRRGNFALITSFHEGNSVMTRTVAVGKAPLMEGQKAAVSMALTREGAELLWESFQSDTPDISLVFDMEFAGIREPYEATLEADWSRVAKHHRLQVGGQYKWFGADVDMLFQELRQDGAIKITTKGESVLMDKIIESANAKLLQVMFDPNAGDELGQMAADNPAYRNLNQAAKLLKESTAARKQNQSYLTPWWRSPLHTAANSTLNLLIHPVQAETQKGGADDAAILEKAKALNTQATELYGQSKYAEAIEKYKLANELFQSVYGRASVTIAYNLASVYQDAKQYQEAILWYGKVIEFLPQDNDLRNKPREAFSYLYMAQCLHQLGRDQEAHEALELATHAEAGDRKGILLIEVGETWLKMSQFCQAIASFKEATHILHEYDTQGKKARKLYQESMTNLYNSARRIDNDARSQGYPANASKQAYEGYDAFKRCAAPEGERGKEVEARLAFYAQKLKSLGVETPETTQPEQTLSQTAQEGEKGLAQNSTTQGSPSANTNTGDTSTGKSATTPDNSVAQAAATALTSAANTATNTATGSSTQPAQAVSGATAASAKPSASKTTSTASAKRKNGSPGFSLVASYQMKQVKRSGTLKYELNQFRTEMQAFAMAENIGPLFARYGNDSQVFRIVNLDDPVFKQREIMVTLDGQDASTFTQYVNFVTVQMRKTHQSGEITLDERVITPQLFNEQGNHFTLMYGYKGDSDRERWLEYEVRATWSYHGGMTVEGAWQKSRDAALSLIPPHRYRHITLAADKSALDTAGVRHAVVTLQSYIQDTPVTRQVTLKNSGTAPGESVDLPQTADNSEIDATINWYFKGGKTLKTSLRFEGDILYWDELPETHQ
jgi:tetratricopeptide (TPR) repeat protein